MEIGDWITLAAVIIALSIGVTSLLQTQKLQRRERKDKVLREIIQWAVDILLCGYETDISSIWTEFELRPRSKGKMQDILVERLQDKFITLEARGAYIWRIALQFNTALQVVILNTALSLSQHVRILRLGFQGKLKHPEAIGRHRKKLEAKTRDVIKNAVDML